MFMCTGTQNSFEVLEMKAGTWDEIYAGKHTRPNWIPPDKRMKYVARTPMPTEIGMKIDATKAKLWNFYNPSAKNGWGANKGYKIVPGKVATQVLPNDEFLLNGEVGGAAAWTKYHLAVTQRKANERYSVSYYDAYNRESAEVSLDHFLNGESIVNEDIVAWVSTGFVHITRAEDSPLTNMHYSSFFIMPFNYFDRNPAMDMGSAVYIRGPSDPGASISDDWRTEEAYAVRAGPSAFLNASTACAIPVYNVTYYGDTVPAMQH